MTDLEAMVYDAGSEVRHVLIYLCDDCRLGAGGQCYTPGCAFWMCTAPEDPMKGTWVLRDRLVTALRAPEVTGALEMLEAQGGSPEDLAQAIIDALGKP